jgi:hypothetical protein
MFHLFPRNVLLFDAETPMPRGEGDRSPYTQHSGIFAVRATTALPGDVIPGLRNTTRCPLDRNTIFTEPQSPMSAPTSGPSTTLIPKMKATTAGPQESSWMAIMTYWNLRMSGTGC